MKRFVGLVIALSLVPAGTAAAHWERGALDIKENRAQVKVDGPGFDVKLTKHGVRADIDDERFGIPEAGYPIVRNAQALPPTVTPFQCENGTYRVVSGTFTTVTRASAPGPRPAPYPASFGTGFPNIFTFVGTLDAVVTNEAGEQLRLFMSDLAHEVKTANRFASINPIHAFIVDEGTCHQTATRYGQPGVTVFGPFFVLPFPSTVIRA